MSRRAERLGEGGTAAAERAEPPRAEWHGLTPEAALELLESAAAGLLPPEAAARLDRFGPNRLPRAEPTPAWRILVAQFRGVVVLLLATAAALSLLLGDRIEAAAIAVVLALNGGIGFFVELRARRAMSALLAFEVPRATVRRGGVPRRIPAYELVPGDVIEVEEGDAIPADGRLLEVYGLRVDEAALTGESVPVDKTEEPIARDGVPLAERRSMAYSGTVVVGGRAVVLVTSTGARTEIGRIGVLLAEVESTATPLEERLDALGRRLAFLTLGVAAAVIAVGTLRGNPLSVMIETGVALAIAAVPEGLPAVATIALAVGLRRMALRNALVRRLSAVEALGSTTVVCTDKTGTLTAGRMTVSAIATVDRELRVTGDGYAPEGRFLDHGREVDPRPGSWLAQLLESCALTDRATIEGEVVRGDPTDAALGVLAAKAGVRSEMVEATQPRVDEVPFDSKLRLSASIHRSPDGGEVVHVKGAPASLLERSTRVATEAGVTPLDRSGREALSARSAALAADGLRVIAIARGDGRGLDDLTFLGLVGIVDPPAQGVAETIASLTEAGVRTVVITGDHAATARTIATRLGIGRGDDTVLEGSAITGLSDAELRERISTVDVYARVSPSDKIRIVAALQEVGEIVAMIGDGVNDAAALKKADVGVAMGGRGTDVAKGASDIVLEDDRFRTVGAAVEEGRVIFDNIRKFVFYLFGCNLAEVAVLMAAAVVGAPLPLLPLQLLWLNLVTDTFPALALALEPAEPDVMRRPPRDPTAPIVSRGFARSLAFFSGLITMATLAAFAWALTSGRGDQAGTIAFVTLALAQLFHLGNARSHGAVLTPERITANPWALAAVPLVLGLQALAVHWQPLATVLETTPLSPREWLVATALAAVPAIVGQAVRAWGSPHKKIHHLPTPGTGGQGRT